MIIQAGLANHESLTQIAKSIVEFDSVIGTLTDKKAILTITLVKYNFKKIKYGYVSFMFLLKSQITVILL